MKKRLAILLMWLLLIGCGQSEPGQSELGKSEPADEAWSDYVAKCRARIPTVIEEMNRKPWSSSWGDYNISFKKTHQEGEMTVTVGLVSKRTGPYASTTICYFAKQNGRWVYEGEEDPLTNHMYTTAIDLLFK